jgi:hypothetical protein
MRSKLIAAVLVLGLAAGPVAATGFGQRGIASGAWWQTVWSWVEGLFEEERGGPSTQSGCTVDPLGAPRCNY